MWTLVVYDCICQVGCLAGVCQWEVASLFVIAPSRDGSSTLCAGGNPWAMHSLLTLWHNLLSDNPGLSNTFCANVMGEQHFTSSGHIVSMMLVAMSSLMAPFRYVHWFSDRGFWCAIFLGNTEFTSMLIWCSAPGMGMTSWTDSAKQLANSATRAMICCCSSSEMSVPILISLNISAMHSSLKGSVGWVNSDVSLSILTSGCMSPLSVTVKSPIIHTAS